MKKRTRIRCRQSYDFRLSETTSKTGSMRARGTPLFGGRSSPGSEKRPSESIHSGSVVLRPRFGCVLIANGSDKVEFRHASEHLACNIRTARVVAEVFGEQFFVPVRSREARLDRYLRN
jgi:hypothetical protein